MFSHLSRLGLGPQGEGRTYRVFPTLAAAKAWRADAVSQLNKGRRVAQTRKTLRTAADAWLAGAKADPPTVLNRSGRPFKPSALRTYERDLEHYILPDLGELRLSDVSRGELKALVDRLIGQGLSASRIRGIVNPIRAIFRDAIEAEEVQVNPTTGLRLPAPTPPARRAAEPTDMSAFLAVLAEDDRALYATAFFAGLRRGELRALRWEDVDLRAGDGAFAGWLTVERAWDDEAGVIEPKSVSSRRRVPIVRPYLSDELEELGERSGRSGAELVFGRTASEPFVPSPVLRRVDRTLETVTEEREKAELKPLERFGLHDGRHTFGAMCRAAGIPQETISEYLGHARSSVTDRYTSPIEAEMQATENMVKLVTYLSRGDTESRLAQLEDAESPANERLRAPFSAENVRAAFAGDPEGFERFLEELRELEKHA